MNDAWNDRLRQDYETWLENNDPNKVECLSDDELRQLIISELEYVSAMSVEEYVLYQKWCEIQRKYPTREVSTIFGQESVLVDIKKKRAIDKARGMIWMPESPEDYLKLEPKLCLMEDEIFNEKVSHPLIGEKYIPRKINSELEQFQTIRTLCHTQRNHNNIGRNMYYLVVDKPTGKYLGVVTISSDFIDLTPRDNFVGWTREQRNGGMLLHTAIGSSILPTQPLGYNYVGGKLLALLCLSDEIQNTWKERYGQTLVGLTTTSLYGSFSQYNNLKHWNKRGKTTGKVVFEPSRSTLYKIRDWVHKKDPVRYWELWFALNEKGQKYKRDHKFRMLGYVYSQLKIKNTESQHQRGIYFSHLYENTPEFLREEITEDKLIKRFDTSTEYLVDLWKNKYASKRIKSLIKNDRVSDTSLFYDDLIYMSWDDTKEKYLEQVGR